MRNAKVIFFDAGGTLFRPYPSVGEIYARTALRHGVTVDAALVEKTFHAQWHKRDGMTSLAVLSTEKIEREWWYALVRDVFGNLAEFDDFDAFFHELYDLFARAECWRLFEDTVPTLEGLKASGYRLGIISNWDHRLFSIVEQLGLSGYFEQVTASALVGSAKPGKKIFEAALAAMKASAAESLHIGDSLKDDYWGARQAGMHAIHLARHSPRVLAANPSMDPLLETAGDDALKYNNVVSVADLHELTRLLAC